jgi:hypothetical protein
LHVGIKHRAIILKIENDGFRHDIGSGVNNS